MQTWKCGIKSFSRILSVLFLRWFMGKVLLEKLLYSCTDLDRIYLLLRTKKGVKSEERLEELYKSQCFDRLRRDLPGVFQSKVFVIAGDVMELGLGLSEEDRALLINRVNIVFHVAASVRFDDPLTYAVKLNLRGTREIVELAKDIRDLNAFVHISTAYSNSNRKVVDEIMYPPHADWRETLEICENLDDHTIRVLTPKLIGNIPNTYAFTKQLAEHVVYEQRGQLPVVIIRPSIVITSVREPVPGWIENFNGPAGILVACAEGIMRSIYSDPELICDYMPVDISIKSFITAAWIRGTKKLEVTDDVAIYNCCAGDVNYIKMREMLELGKEIIKMYPLDNALWHRGGQLTKSKTVHYVQIILFQVLPAVIVDMILWLLGKNPLLVKIQRRIYIANMALCYYVTQQWTFINDNLLRLRSSIKKDDIEKFYYEMEEVDRMEFFKNSALGGRRYLLKEKDEDLPAARTHYFRMKIIDHVVKGILYALITWWILNTYYFKDILYKFFSLFT